MSNILTIDNFSRIEGLPNDTSWLKTNYNIFGKFTNNSFANSTNGSTPSLYLSGRSIQVANWNINYPLPNEYTKYTLGFRILDIPKASQGTASLGIIANVTNESYDVVLAIELTPTGANVHYKDEEGAKVQTISFTYAVGTYIDWTIDKISNLTNDLSRFTLIVDNFPVFSSKIFNNVGINLSLAIGGVIPVTPNEEDGYLTSVTLQDLVPTNLDYGITDLYISKNGVRFGKPEVTSTQVTTTEGDFVPNVPNITAAEVLQQGPSNWTFITGTGKLTSNYEQAPAEHTQVRAMVQTQADELIEATLTLGTKEVQAVVTSKPTTVSVVTEGAVDTASLEV